MDFRGSSLRSMEVLIYPYEYRWEKVEVSGKGCESWLRLARQGGWLRSGAAALWADRYRFQPHKCAWHVLVLHCYRRTH